MHILNSAVAVDASQFCTGGFNAVLHQCINSSNSTGSTGNTMWEAISAAIASPLNVSGVIDARAFQGPQLVKAGVGTTALYGCNGNPLACQVGGVSTPTPPGSKVNGVLLLGNVTNYCDGPSGGNYTDGNSNYGTPCIIVPWGFQIIGSAKFTTNVVGTTFAPCLGSNNPVTGCNAAFPKRSLSISAISVTSTTMTLTSSNPLTITGGPTNNQNIYVGELVAISGATNSVYNVLRTVQTLPSSPGNTFTVSVPNGTSTTGCSGGNCGTAYLVTPFIGFGYQNNSSPPCNAGSSSTQCAYVPVRVGANQSFASRVINLSFDLESQPGAVAVQNLNGGEQSGMSTIYCRHPYYGVRTGW